MFTLQDISAQVVASQDIATENIPNLLQEKVYSRRSTITKPSEIVCEFELYDQYLRVPLDAAVFPQYIVMSGFPYPVLVNTTTQVHACVPSHFDCMTLHCVSRKSLQISDLLGFISDVSGCEISCADVYSTDYSTETEVLIDDRKYVVHHRFYGYLSTLLKLLNIFKHQSFSHFSHYLTDVNLNGEKLVFDGMEHIDSCPYEMLMDA